MLVARKVVVTKGFIVPNLGVLGRLPYGVITEIYG